MRIYEPAIYMRQLPDGVPDGTAQRTECLWNCLEACEDLVAAYLASPVEKVGMVPITATACMSFAVVTASRLAFLEDPGWDASLARKRLDLATVVRRIEEYLQAADVYQAASGRKRRYFDDSRSALAMYGDRCVKSTGGTYPESQTTTCSRTSSGSGSSRPGSLSPRRSPRQALEAMWA